MGTYIPDDLKESTTPTKEFKDEIVSGEKVVSIHKRIEEINQYLTHHMAPYGFCGLTIDSRSPDNQKSIHSLNLEYMFSLLVKELAAPIDDGMVGVVLWELMLKQYFPGCVFSHSEGGIPYNEVISFQWENIAVTCVRAWDQRHFPGSVRASHFNAHMVKPRL